MYNALYIKDNYINIQHSERFWYGGGEYSEKKHTEPKSVFTPLSKTE